MNNKVTIKARDNQDDSVDEILNDVLRGMFKMDDIADVYRQEIKQELKQLLLGKAITLSKVNYGGGDAETLEAIPISEIEKMFGEGE